MSPFEKKYRPEYAVELLEIARGDLESADALASTGRGRPENVAYLAHQAVEKSLKAVVCAHGRAIMHTHDLEALLITLPSEITRPPDEQSLKALTEYSLVRRYERGYAVLEAGDLEAAIALARAAVEWAAKYVGAP